MHSWWAFSYNPYVTLFIHFYKHVHVSSHFWLMSMFPCLLVLCALVEPVGIPCSLFAGHFLDAAQLFLGHVLFSFGLCPFVLCWECQPSSIFVGGVKKQVVLGLVMSHQATSCS